MENHSLLSASPNQVDWALITKTADESGLAFQYRGQPKPRVLSGLRFDLIDEAVGNDDDDDERDGEDL